MTLVETRLKPLPVFAVAAHGVSVSHVADSYRRYPGEPVTFYTQVGIHASVPGFTLRIELPEGLMPDDAVASENHAGQVADVLVVEDGHHVVWRVEKPLQAGEQFEYELQATVGQFNYDTELASSALLIAQLSDEERLTISESAQIAIETKGRYLRHLPMLYEDDELMGRFLMLFESFWNPIEKQINQAWYYFDPKLTTPDLLPFLASWVDLALDDRWPEDRRRLLLLSAAALHRRRGTSQGMREILEIFTGGSAFITEHTANNFRIGPHALLGRSIALGRANRPHTFSVHLRMPTLEAEDDAQAEIMERERRQTIKELIEANKPAHATYTLNIEYA